jgi:HD superfamily phosphohydrolase
MSVFDQIREALDRGNLNASILAFGNYHIKKWLGNGEQGVVVQAEGPIGKIFAIKFFKPLQANGVDAEGTRAFQREVETLAKFNHSNIVRVYTGGTACFRNIWNVREGFGNTKTKSDVHYYMMDYIDERLDDIFEELTEDLQVVVSPTYGPVDVSLRRKTQLFEQMIVQLTGAMSYYHKERITHKDIKPENIRFGIRDTTFVLVDFGFARHLGSNQDEYNVHKKRCLDWQAIIAKDYVRADIGALSMILRRILPGLAPIYQGWRYDGLKESIDRALSHNFEQRYTDSADFGKQLRRFFVMSPAWNLTLSLNECLTPSQFGRFTSKLRIPVSGSIQLTKEVAAIVDSPGFQRLRGVRQLGPTMFVFPGANHTRFEHSLGTYDLALKYLERVLRNPHGRHLDEHLDHSVKLVVLSALLHDIGHYPYSHWVEEIDKFPDGVEFVAHEKRARDIITTGAFAQLISSVWEVEPEEVARVISGEKLGHEPGLLLANSFIDSAVDVDKVDYLVRDSIHCGVDYGRGIDVERLFDSLYVDIEKTRLCIMDKGLTSLLSLLTCRNIMYEAVYWHKTVRACEAMFKRFFYEFVGLGCIPREQLEQYLKLSDDAFTMALYDKSSKNELLRALMTPFVFQGRTVYKPAYIFNEGQVGNEPPDTKAFFGRALMNNSYQYSVEMSNKLVEKLKNEIPDLQPLEVLLETTPTKEQHTWYDLQGLRVWHSRKKEYRDLPPKISEVNEYLGRNRQAYLFCHPRHYHRLVEIAMSKKLNQIFSEVKS